MPQAFTWNIGTTGSTVALVDGRGKLRGSVNVEFTQHYPKPGWVEHDPAEIWRVSKRVMRGALLAQAETGATLNVHPGRDPAQPRLLAREHLDALVPVRHGGIESPPGG